MNKIRSLSMFFFALALAMSIVAVPRAAAQQAPAVVRDGKTAATAAASCWDIKQRFPDSADGAYWLLTPGMGAPEQFFCDQTMDGGGWVQIGRGREGWDRYPDGKGKPSDLLTRDRTPASFGAVQLPIKTVNGLLNGTQVNTLPDGFRVVRASNSSGTSWQTVDVRPQKMTDWTWALATEDTANFRFGENGGWYQSGIMRNPFGFDSAYNQLDLSMTSARKYNMGFGFGPRVYAGSTSPSDFLWSSTGNAPLPYSEVYIRPRIGSDDPGFARIADSGTAASAQRALASSFSSPTSWGVTGNLNGRTSEGNSPVQAFAEIGETIYVGGNFTKAENHSSGASVDRTAIAAFDRSTGELRPGFSLQLDNQVKALLPLPNGKLLVGGDFRTANGERHVGTVLVDPATGEIDHSWALDITNRLSSGVVSVKSLARTGDHIYLGGAFTHLATDGSSFVYARSAGRVSLEGVPDRSWNPEFNGTVVDIDTSPAGDRFYAAGYFTKSVDNVAEKAAVLSTAPGAAPVSDWVFQGSASSRSNYQQAVADTGALVFFGGSEHALFGYEPASMNRISGSVTKNVGGDIQAIASNGDITYAGCHCSDSVYQNAYSWSVLNSDWNKVDNIQWVGAWDAHTGQQLGEFSPYMLRSNNAGAWSLFLASDGALWVGGDFTGSRTSLDRSQWNGGFVRYPAKDSVAPATPSGFVSAGGTAEAVSLRWDSVADADHYEILRDDRVVATTTSTSVQAPRGGEGRFFVRAVDAAGNRSASTSVALAGEPGEVPQSATTLVGPNTQWAYLYNNGTAAADWAENGADRSTWATGSAPIGYGGTGLATTLNAPDASLRPVTTWFATTFDVADPRAFTSATLSFVADDGAVAYLNGHELGRTRMPDGALSPETRANAAVTAAAAAQDRTIVKVPSYLLAQGANTLAVETHLNYKSSPSMTFDASLEISDTNPAPLNAEIIAPGAQWNYTFALDEPEADWATDGDTLAWGTGIVPIGWGDAGVVTPLTVPVTERARTAYFVHDVTIDPADYPSDAKLVLTVRADDGAVVRVNGEEVGRKRVGTGPVDHYTYADQAVTTATAIGDPIVVEIPVSQLHAGTNRIGVETHVNYRGTPSMTFDASARMVQG